MRKLDLSLSLTSAAMAVRSAFKIASVNPVLWWDAESHRAGLAGITPVNADIYLNGDYGITNLGTAPCVFTPYGDVKPSKVQSKFGGSSLYFDGAGDYISTSNLPVIGTGDFSIECWVNVNPASLSNNGLFQVSPASTGLGSPSNSLALSVVGGGQLNLYAANGNQITNSIIFPVQQNQWTHLVLERYGGVSKVYANGIVVISLSDVTDYTATKLAVGGYYSTGYLMNGYIDNFKLAVGSATYKSTAAVGTQVFDPNALAVPSVKPPVLYRDAVGVTAVTAVEQPVGRVADVSGSGNAAMQATSTARPVLTARKNLLTYSEQFNNSVWQKARIDVLQNVATAPDGTLTADLLYGLAGQASPAVYRVANPVWVGGGKYVYSVFFKVAGHTTIKLSYVDTAVGYAGGTVIFTLTGAGSASSSGGATGLISEEDDGWYRCSIAFKTVGSPTYHYISVDLSHVGDGVSGVYAWGAQLELSPAATSYQRVTTATDYDITAAPLMLQFDGVDDALSTGTFAAGTLPADADVYMVMDRGADDFVVPVMSSDITYMFCMIGDGALANRNSGTPSVQVNGVPVVGGSAVTRGDLLSAVPANAAILLSAHGADLSAWTKVAVSAYGGVLLTGKVGCLLITPAQPDATRAKIRKALAKAYQITGAV